MLLPFRLEIERERKPVVLYTILVGTITVFLLQQFFLIGPEDEFYIWGGLLPGVFSWKSDFTSIFLHGSWLHIAGNMFFLWFFGRCVEDRLGHTGFAFFYVSAGLISGWINSVNVADQFLLVPTIGASGAISGVLGAFLILYPFAKIRCLFVSFMLRHGAFLDIPAALMLAAWFFLQIFTAYIAIEIPEVIPVAFSAHIGGFLYGMLIAMAIFYWKANYNEWRMCFRSLKWWRAFLLKNENWGKGKEVLESVDVNAPEYSLSRMKLGDWVDLRNDTGSVKNNYRKSLSKVKTLNAGARMSLYYRICPYIAEYDMQIEEVLPLGMTLVGKKRYQDALYLFAKTIVAMKNEKRVPNIVFLIGETFDYIGNNEMAMWV
ncbi:MAG: rhomboid family intramembrane serine protease, partial [Candidatus Theseobacter exili]|nr:rhomboid family intramembrane serine protease [Candidatus Theseobacter exili]